MTPLQKSLVEYWRESMLTDSIMRDMWYNMHLCKPTELLSIGSSLRPARET
jgi:hypothetical protein